MHCARCEELLSARLDGETTAIEDEAVTRHVARCGSCARFEASLRRLPVVAAPPGGPPTDLTVRVLDRLAWSPGSEAPDWARYGLLVVALTEVVLALPQLFARWRGMTAHDLHHLGAWDLAFGVGLVVVAWQPERARGLLPFAGALGVGMAVTAVFDISDRGLPVLTEAHHLLELLGVLLLWVVGRSFRLRPSRRRGPRGPGLPPPSSLRRSGGPGVEPVDTGAA